MARKVEFDARPVASNPTFLGEDLGALAWEALGAGLAGYGNDRIVAPVVRQAVPGLYGGGAASKVADLATTAGTAWLLSELAGFFSNQVARRFRRGGMFLVVVKTFTGFLPGYAGSVSFAVPGIPQIAAGNNQSPKQLSAARGVNPAAAAGAYSAVRSATMGL